MNIDSEIISSVKKVLNKFQNKYITKNGGLKRSKVIEDLDNFDKNLMTELFNNKLIYKDYVEKINNIDVFKLNQFIEMFEYKQFWEDSYTKYSNKIGLASDNKFIDESSDVVLDFPFKDTVFKGNMKNESEEDSDESFLNENIARSEIDELFEPKIFKNVKKIDINGIKNNNNFQKDNNLIIKGNNLLALYSIKKIYKNKIKSIVLDPPYFFKDKKPADTFPYNSNFKLSTWLTFMKNRLEISKELLNDYGLIFLTISDEGAHYLKVMADSIFGMNNFIADITWESRSSISSDGLMSSNSNHVLIYANDITKIDKNNFRLSLDIETFKYDDHDGKGKYRIEPFDAPNIRKNLEYGITNPNDGKTFYPPKGRCWRTTEKTFQQLVKNNKIRFGKNGKSKPQLKTYYNEVKETGKGKASSTIWKNIKQTNSISWLNTNTNTSATKHQRTLFGYNAFKNPKPEELIKRIIELSTDNDDIVMDFFMGSATTQAVAMKMHRRFIGMEQMDYINTVSVPRLQKVIEGEQGGVSKDVDWHGGGSFVYAELMEKNKGYLNDILQSKSLKELDSVYDRMKNIDDLDFRLDLDKYEESKSELNLEERKRIMVKMLDKNQLYYNYNNIDDENVRDLISDSDYKFNKSFYDEGE